MTHTLPTVPAPSTGGAEHLTRVAWMAAAQQRYGADSSKWRFRRPVCGVATAVQEWKDAGAAEGTVAFSCIGRYLPAEPSKAFGAGKVKQPCDYAGGGLLRFNPVRVVDEEGHQHQVFDFADDPLAARQALAAAARSDAERGA